MAPLLLALAWAVSFGLLAWLGLLTVLTYQSVGTAVAVVVLIFLPALGLWGVAKAGAQGGAFLIVFTVLVVLVSDVSLRGKAQGLDAQSLAKFALWAAGLLLLPWRSGVLTEARKDLPTFALLLFGLFALVGTAYSITPLYTFAAALAFLGMWMTAVVLATSVDTGRALTWIVAALLAMAIASVLFYLIAPGMAMIGYENGAVPRLGGIFFNANVLGSAVALALLLVFVGWSELPRRTAMLLALIAVPVCGFCLYMTHSRTSVLALAAGLSVVLVRRRPFLLMPVLVMGMSGVAVSLAYPGAIDALISLIARAGRVDSVTTLTGRTEIWEFVVSAIAKAPILGYGFASTKELIPAGYTGPYGWTTASAHNLWLQAWVTTGGVGLALILTHQLSAIKALVTRPLPVRDGVLAFVLVGGVLEAGPVGPSVSLITLIWIWATALSLRHPRETAEGQQPAASKRSD